MARCVAWTARQPTWLADRWALTLVWCRQRAVQSMELLWRQRFACSCKRCTMHRCRYALEWVQAWGTRWCLLKPCRWLCRVLRQKRKLVESFAWLALVARQFWSWTVGDLYLGHAHAWAPVCREGFTSCSTAVACRSMGCAGFCKVFEVQRQWRVCDVPPHAFSLACAGSDSIATQGDNVFCAPEESVAVSCSGASDPIDKRMWEQGCFVCSLWQQPRLPRKVSGSSVVVFLPRLRFHILAASKRCHQMPALTQ